MTIQNFSITPIIVLIIQGLLAWALWSIRQAFVREEDYSEHVENTSIAQQACNAKVSKLESSLLGLEDRINLLPDVNAIAHLAGTVESLRGDLKAIDTRITGLDRLLERLERALDRTLDRQELILRDIKISA